MHYWLQGSVLTHQRGLGQHKTNNVIDSQSREGVILWEVGSNIYTTCTATKSHGLMSVCDWLFYCSLYYVVQHQFYVSGLNSFLFFYSSYFYPSDLSMHSLFGNSSSSLGLVVYKSCMYIFVDTFATCVFTLTITQHHVIHDCLSVSTSCNMQESYSTCQNSPDERSMKGGETLLQIQQHPFITIVNV